MAYNTFSWHYGGYDDGRATEVQGSDIFTLLSASLEEMRRQVEGVKLLNSHTNDMVTCEWCGGGHNGIECQQNTSNPHIVPYNHGWEEDSNFIWNDYHPMSPPSPRFPPQKKMSALEEALLEMTASCNQFATETKIITQDMEESSRNVEKLVNKVVASSSLPSFNVYDNMPNFFYDDTSSLIDTTDGINECSQDNRIEVPFELKMQEPEEHSYQPEVYPLKDVSAEAQGNDEQLGESPREAQLIKAKVLRTIWPTKVNFKISTASNIPLPFILRFIKKEEQRKMVDDSTQMECSTPLLETIKLKPRFEFPQRDLEGEMVVSVGERHSIVPQGKHHPNLDTTSSFAAICPSQEKGYRSDFYFDFSNDASRIFLQPSFELLSKGAPGAIKREVMVHYVHPSLFKPPWNVNTNISLPIMVVNPVDPSNFMPP